MELSVKCENSKSTLFRGLIKAGLCRTLLHIKIRQKLKSATAQPELLGKVRLLVSFSFLKACKFHSILSSSGSGPGFDKNNNSCP